MENIEKSPAESYTESAHLVTLADMNGYKRLFGGRLMEWIDICAAVTARRHAQHNVTTVKVEELVLKEPAWANNLVVLCGTVVWVGRTSMDVKVESFIENLDGKRIPINSAVLTLVALDENDHPTPVPRLKLTTDAQKAAWHEAELRRGKVK